MHLGNEKETKNGPKPNWLAMPALMLSGEFSNAANFS